MQADLAALSGSCGFGRGRDEQVRMGVALGVVLAAIGAASAGFGPRAPVAVAAVSPPTVGAVAPSVGPTTGSSRVTVTGYGFSQVRSVLFGSVAGTSVTVVSSRKLTVSAPRHAAGTVDIRVRTQSGISAIRSADRFTYLSRPTVTAVAPAGGRVSGGDTVMVSGTGFVHVASVTIGSTPARSWKVLSSDRLSVATPAGGTGTVDVHVRTPAGTSATSAADRFSYLPAPAVSSLSPAAGPSEGGNRVLISGRNFTAVTGVRFGSAPATGLTVLSSTSLVATVPAGQVGPVDVQVASSFGASTTSAADQYSYAAAPGAPTVTAVTAPGPFSPPSWARPIIGDTACTDATCYAVGYYQTGDADVAIIETLDDGVWSWSYAPRPADAASPPAGRLYAIWCGSDGCVAVGAYLNSKGRTLPLVETLTGGTWTAGAGTHPGGVFDAYYDSVACATVTSCAVSGLSPGGSILADLTAGSWTTDFMPMPAGASVKNVARSTIACGSASYCVFVGEYDDGTNLHAFAETYSGGAWTPALLPTPPGGETWSQLYDVACPSSNECVAVGASKSSDDTIFRGLIATDTDGTWRTTLAPSPADLTPNTSFAGKLTSISCSAGGCTAAGEYTGANGIDSFVEVLQKGHWSAMPAKKADAATTSRAIFDVACPTAGHCLLVGQDSPASGSTTGVVAVNTPGGTAQETVPLPSDVSTANLFTSNAACTPSGTCTAIGTLSTNPSQSLLLTITT